MRSVSAYPRSPSTRYAIAVDRREGFFRRFICWRAIEFFMILVYRHKHRLSLYFPCMRKAVLGAFAAAFFMKLFIFDLVIAEGISMTPAIESGKVLVVSRLVYGLRLPWKREYLLRWAMPKRGEIVVFYTPTGEIAVKRCGGIRDDGFFTALGDNSLQSLDSRSYGPVPADSIIGKVLGIK
jgi:signal peptidase I